MRKSNLKKILTLNNIDNKLLTDFVEFDKKYIMAVPRGIICHWVAGNVMTLPFFSLIQSILVRNKNLIRVSKNTIQSTNILLEHIKNFSSEKFSGKELLKLNKFLYFKSENTELNNTLSLIADARVIWGGINAVDNILKLEKLSHCEDIVFGPKYSFAVIDSEGLRSPKLDYYIENLVKDIIFVEQTACTSPHTIFIENNIENVIDKLVYYFKKHTMNREYTKTGNLVSNINFKRSEFVIKGDKIKFGENNDWSILINNEIKLEEPIYGRTVFLKKIKDLEEIYPLITNEVQSIGAFIPDFYKLKEFAKNVGYRGVARVIPPGLMHIYDTPWDGMLLLHRLVRWIKVTKVS